MHNFFETKHRPCEASKSLRASKAPRIRRPRHQGRETWGWVYPLPCQLWDLGYFVGAASKLQLRTVLLFFYQIGRY